MTEGQFEPIVQDEEHNVNRELAEKVLDNKEDLPPLPTEGTGTA